MKTVKIYAGKKYAEEYVPENNGSTTSGVTSTVAALGFVALAILAVISILI